jgi:hypothetical protein
MNKSLGNMGIFWALLIIGCWFSNLYYGINLELSFSNPWVYVLILLQNPILERLDLLMIVSLLTILDLPRTIKRLDLLN